jgi:hypothetical protein
MTEITEKNTDCWTVYYKERVMGLHLIFWPNNQIEGNTEKSELNHNKKYLLGIKFSCISHDETFPFLHSNVTVGT